MNQKTFKNAPNTYAFKILINMQMQYIAVIKILSIKIHEIYY